MSCESFHKRSSESIDNSERSCTVRPEQVLIPIIRQIVSRPKLAGATLGRFDPWGNPYAEEVFADPMVLAPAIRESDRVYWHPLYQQWFITGYEEAKELLASPHVGTADQMALLLLVRPYNKLSDQSRTMIRNLLLLTDPPQHTRLRQLVSRAFTPKQVSRLEPWMELVVDEMLDEFGAEVDLMSEFAMRFPARVIGELIGFGRDEWKWLQRLSATITKITDPMSGFDPEDMDGAIDELRRRVLDLAAERRANPTDDLMSGLVAASDDQDGRLSEDELVATTAIMLIAGHETTSAMIGMSLLHLYDNPDQIQLLEEKPDLWPNAVEELLRYDPAFRTDPRHALADFELGGKQIKKGQNLVVTIASEQAWLEPNFVSRCRVSSRR